jgi:hypothetical protein
VAVISRAGACFDERSSAGTQCAEKAVVRGGVDPRDLRQLGDVGAPGRSIEVGDGVGPEGRKNALAQTVGG